MIGIKGFTLDDIKNLEFYFDYVESKKWNKERYRDIFKMYYILGNTRKEIASKYNITTTRVDSILKNCLLLLKMAKKNKEK